MTNIHTHKNPVERFYSLDVLRGIAALSVVFFHWEHFFYDGLEVLPFDFSRLPLSDWVPFLYLKGWRAVDLFFSLSGFVFYWLYAERISDGQTQALKFALLRFSRLYPLHFVTLVLVALAQVWVMTTEGKYYVHPENDAKHFLLNVLMVSAWGFEDGYSFNGPFWSVSVEIFLYLMFFVCCRLLPIKIYILAGLSIAGFFIKLEYGLEIGRGMGSFFLGGCIFLMYQFIVASRHAAAVTKWIGYLTIALWIVTLTISISGADLEASSVWSMRAFARFGTQLRAVVHQLVVVWPVLVLFPLSILSLALHETRKGPMGKKMSFVGDISYSSYLLHYPLQFLVVIGAKQFALDGSIYYSPWFMAVFFAVLIAISLISYRFFEMPMQKLLRRSLVFRKKPAQTGDVRVRGPA